VLTTEENFTLDEIAQRLKVSKSSARRLFMREDGVLFVNALGKRSTEHGRVRIRVPLSVYERVIGRMRHAS
jgi:methylphosphotriester-DNA--protein-cysteine methyltransferase